MPIRDGLLAEFDHEIAATRRVLRALADDRLPWRPHHRSRSAGELAAHMIDIVSWAPHILDATRVELDTAPEPSPALLSLAGGLNELDDAAARARRLIDVTDGELAASWSLVRGGQELFSMPRSAACRTFVLGHLIHHRGQLSVYLRLMDLVVPPIYGPTADGSGSSVVAAQDR